MLRKLVATCSSIFSRLPPEYSNNNEELERENSSAELFLFCICEPLVMESLFKEIAMPEFKSCLDFDSVSRLPGLELSDNLALSSFTASELWIRHKVY